jgi:anti-anti-sigma factor
MNLSIEKNDKYIIVKLLDDKVNDNISTELKYHLIALNNDGAKNIILDLSKVTYCDSSGLNTILAANTVCKNSNGSFVITGLNEKVRKIIHNSQLEKVLFICPTVEEAIDLVFMEEIERNLDN